MAILHTRLDGMTGLLGLDFCTQTGLGQHVDIGLVWGRFNKQKRARVNAGRVFYE